MGEVAVGMGGSGVLIWLINGASLFIKLRGVSLVLVLRPLSIGKADFLKGDLRDSFAPERRNCAYLRLLFIRGLRGVPLSPCNIGNVLEIWLQDRPVIALLLIRYSDGIT